MTGEYRHRQRRCPRLGGPVTFEYCLTSESDRQPCWKIVDCWWESFDVTAFLEDNLSQETFGRLQRRQVTSKTATLVELIEQARRRQAAQDPPSDLE